MEWISVEDRLPEVDGEWYLIASESDNPNKSHFVTMAFFDKSERYGIHWLCHNDEYKCKFEDGWEDVTHWMPLPKSPKENES